MRGVNNLRHLEAFKAVIEEGSVSKAAQVLFITQPATSKLLTSLEEQSQLKLFERRKGHLSPTAEGMQLYECTVQIFAGLQQFNNEIELIRNNKTRAIRIGFLPALSGRYAVDMSKALCQLSPGLQLSIVARSSQLIRGWLINGKLDIGFTGAPIDHPDFHSQAILPAALVCILPKGHPLTGKSTITPQDLHQVDFVNYNSGGASSALHQNIFNRYGVKPKYVINGTTAAIVTDLVAAGFGAGLVHPVATLYNENVVTRRFKPDTEITYFLSYIRDNHHQLPVKELNQAVSLVEESVGLVGG